MTQTSGQLREIEERLPSDQTGIKIGFLQRFVLRVPPTWVLSVIVGIVALGFNLYRLGSPSLWFDEILSVERARQPLPVLWHIIFSTQQNMAFYYLSLHFWLNFTTLLGLHATEFVVRFPSAVFAALASMMVFLLGRRFLGVVGGLVGAGLYVLNTLQLVYAQETRSYSLQLLLICLGWYALFSASVSGAGATQGSPLRIPSTPAPTGDDGLPLRGMAKLRHTVLTQVRQKRWWLCYTIAMTLAVYTQLFSVLVLFAQVVAFGSLLLLPTGWRAQVRQQLLAFVVSLVSIGILSIPMVLALRHGSKTGWLPIPHLQDIYTLFLSISSDSNAYLLILAACSVLGAGVALFLYVRRRESQSSAILPVAISLICWVIMPVVASYLISQKSTHLFSVRYLVTIVPALFLLVGLGIAVLRWLINFGGTLFYWRFFQGIVVVGLLLLALHHVPQYYATAQVEDWRTGSLWLEQHYQPNDGLVCYDNAQGCQVAIEYYLYAYSSPAHFTADAPGSFSWVSYDLTNALGNADAAVDPTALAAYGAQHLRLFFIAGRFANNAEVQRAQAAVQWLDAHYHLIAQITTSTVTIRLYATG